jgi:hypothetical protein
MIENKEMGLEIAEDKEEALWIKVAEECKAMIEQSERNLIIQKEFLKAAESHIKK